MYNYYKVFVHYCTSDLYAGRRDADEASGNYTFHGKYVVEAVVEDLLKVFSLLEVDIPQFVIMGASAGMVYQKYFTLKRYFQGLGELQTTATLWQLK